MFQKLTRVEGEAPEYVDFSTGVRFQERTKGGTRIMFPGQPPLIVVETPEEVLKAAAESNKKWRIARAASIP